MPGPEHGCVRAISETVGGIISGTLLNAFISNGLIPSHYIALFKLISLLTIISLIIAMPYWGTGYMIGWLLGIIIMAKSGLISAFDALIYIVIPLVILIVRMIRRAEFSL